MKTPVLLLAALLAGAGAAQAQLTPTSPQRSGVANQTTLPPANPTTANNPGTISQQSTDPVPALPRNSTLGVNPQPGQSAPVRDGSYLPAGRVPTPAATDRPLRPRAGRRGTSPTQPTTPRR